MKAGEQNYSDSLRDSTWAETITITKYSDVVDKLFRELYDQRWLWLNRLDDDCDVYITQATTTVALTLGQRRRQRCLRVADDRPGNFACTVQATLPYSRRRTDLRETSTARERCLTVAVGRICVKPVQPGLYLNWQPYYLELSS